jgi:NAD(P)-dependent dehydrogenase (short-subunit alcohol dehydrogenase family)
MSDHEIRLSEIAPAHLFDLTGRNAVVIGTGGLGGVAALGVAACGSKVAVADYNIESARNVAHQIVQEQGSAQAFSVDITDFDSVQQLFEQVTAVWGRVHVLVNTAAITLLGSPEDFPIDMWHKIIETNLSGTYIACRVGGRHMLENGGGSIINFSSIAGQVGLTQTPAYCASKGGVSQLTKALALEWAERGVRVNALAPSYFATDIVLKTMTPERDQLYKDRLAKVPMKRMGKPWEIAGAVMFLASEASSMVTGALIPVDGGYLAQ